MRPVARLPLYIGALGDEHRREVLDGAIRDTEQLVCLTVERTVRLRERWLEFLRGAAVSGYNSCEVAMRLRGDHAWWGSARCGAVRSGA